MTVREKAELIVKDIKKEQGTNPVVIFKQIAEKEYISIGCLTIPHGCLVCVHRCGSF